MADERRHLRPSQADPHRRALVRPLLLVDELLEHHDDPVVGLVVGDADGADGPDLLEGFGEPQIACRDAVRGGLEVVEEAVEVLGQRGHLLLLAAEGDLGVAVAGLEVEDPLPGIADRAGGEHVWGGQVVGRHDGARADSSPVEFTARTTGPSTP